MTSVKGQLKTKPRLKLFVWEGFSPDYTDGLAFAIAKDEAEARSLITEACGYAPSTWGELSVRPLTRKVAFAVSGGG